MHWCLTISFFIRICFQNSINLCYSQREIIISCVNKEHFAFFFEKFFSIGNLSYLCDCLKNYMYFYWTLRLRVHCSAHQLIMQLDTRRKKMHESTKNHYKILCSCNIINTIILCFPKKTQISYYLKTDFSIVFHIVQLSQYIAFSVVSLDL